MHHAALIRLARRAHRLAGWALVVAVAAQMAMATFGLFVLLGARGYALHGSVGRIVALLPLLLLAAALAGRLDRRDLVAAVGLVGVAALQVGLVLLSREGVGLAMALHPINAGALLALAGYAAARSGAMRIPDARGQHAAPNGVAPAVA